MSIFTKSWVVTPTPGDPPTPGNPPRLWMQSPSLNERIKKAISSKNYEEAVLLNTEGISLYPRCPYYYIRRAITNIFLHNYQEALTDAANALLLDQGHRLLRVQPYYHSALTGLEEFDHSSAIVSEGLKIDFADMLLLDCLETTRCATTSKRAILGHSSLIEDIGDAFEGGEMWLKLWWDVVAREYWHDPEFQRKVYEARRDILRLGEYLREDDRFLKSFEILLKVKFLKNIGRAPELESEMDGNIVPLLRKLSPDAMFAIVEYEEDAKEAELLKRALERADIAEEETEEK